VERVAALSLPLWASRLRDAGTALAGVAAVLVATRSSGWTGTGTTAVALVAALVGWWTLARGARLLPVAYGAMLLGALAGIALGRVGGGP
jgi:hypothetical protein